MRAWSKMSGLDFVVPRCVMTMPFAAEATLCPLARSKFLAHTKTPSPEPYLLYSATVPTYQCSKRGKRPSHLCAPPLSIHIFSCVAALLCAPSGLSQSIACPLHDLSNVVRSDETHARASYCNCHWRTGWALTSGVHEKPA